MTTEVTYTEDEIDLRKIVTTILKYKWWIVGTAILFSLAGFLITKFVLPKVYQATAYVIITKPSLTANLDSRIQTSFQLPDIKSLTDLTKADDLIMQVFNSPELAEYTMQEGTSLESLKGNLETSLVGTSQLKLVVTNSQPELAANIVNVWANLVVLRLNNLYGTQADSIQSLQQQAEQAKQEWDAAENAFLEYLPESQKDILQVNLAQARRSLETDLNKIDGLDRLISDASVIKTRLSEQNSNRTLLLEDGLGLMALQQRAVGQLEGVQIQTTGPEVFGEQYTVAEALKNLDVLISSLENQREELLANLDERKANIVHMGTDLELATYQVDQLSVQRDLRLKAYEALSSRVEEMKITLSQNDQTAKVAGLALPPSNPSGPRSLYNALLAGAVGFVLALSVVLVIHWWRSG